MWQSVPSLAGRFLRKLCIHLCSPPLDTRFPVCLYEQVNEAAEIIYDLVDANANLIFGAVVDPALGQEVSE